jgi:hypothetical protein
VQRLVVFIFVDAIERNLNDRGDDVWNIIANGKIKIVDHIAPSSMVVQEQIERLLHHR